MLKLVNLVFSQVFSSISYFAKRIKTETLEKLRVGVVDRNKMSHVIVKLVATLTVLVANIVVSYITRLHSAHH